MIQTSLSLFSGLSEILHLFAYNIINNYRKKKKKLEILQLHYI